jgi:hypothetical protein
VKTYIQTSSLELNPQMDLNLGGRTKILKLLRFLTMEEREMRKSSF